MATELTRRFGGSFDQLPRDWAKKYLQRTIASPVRIGRRLLIVSQTQSLPDDRAQLVIPAAGAFGTGEHATTAMSLRLIEETSRQWTDGWRMLDLGTGTGILALASRRFGAREILGLDYDVRAIAHARANARLNKIGSARFVRQDLLRWQPTRRFDLIAANLFSELLIASATKLQRTIRRNGRLIVSGILREQSAEVAAALGKAGCAIEKKRSRGKWIALLCVAEPHSAQ